MSFNADEFDYQVLNLTEKFYRDYPETEYREILRKGKRPYNCLLIQSSYGYFICIPYRSHINHRFAYKFKWSLRSKQMDSGLDYSKIVIITDKDYVGETDAIVDQDEFNETRDNIEHIKRDAQKYINDYVEHEKESSGKYDSIEFARIYRYSTLKYFHKELGIDSRAAEIFTQKISP